MKLSFSNLFVVLFVFAGFSFAKAAQVDPRLNAFARQSSAQKVRVIALMTANSHGFVSPTRYNFKSVHQYLVNRSKASWAQVKPLIERSNFSGNDIQVQNIFYINNSLVADVTSAGLQRLAQIPMIEKIYFNGPIQLGEPTISSPRGFAARLARGEYTYGLKDLGIEELMKTKPQIQGQGVFIGHIDTGVDGKHPALAGKIALFYDAASNSIQPPTDSYKHGSHTAGTILGGDRKSTIIGVAPEAKLIASGALESYDDMLRAMEFMLDPDKNPNTNDRPRLISNSWNCGGAPDVELFYRAVEAWEAAGILPVFSAGNAGPKPQTITPPHEHPNAYAIGATDSNGMIASFSSRGPGLFRGQKTQKPDVTAPGVAVYSSVPGGGFQTMSGTSMAAPHAAGLAALLFQVNPALTPVQVREILTRTARFVDANGAPIPVQAWNPNYGFGRLNGLEAIRVAASMIGQRIGSFRPQFFLKAFDASQPTLSLVSANESAIVRLDHTTRIQGQW
jgi:subtilisin family serine protease